MVIIAPVAQLDLATGTQVACTTKVLDLLNWRATFRTRLAYAPAVQNLSVPAATVVQVSFGIPATQIHSLLQRFPDGLMERAPFLPDDVNGPPPGMDPGSKENILQVTVSHSPDASLLMMKNLTLLESSSSSSSKSPCRYSKVNASLSGETRFSPTWGCSTSSD